MLAALVSLTLKQNNGMNVYATRSDDSMEATFDSSQRKLVMLILDRCRFSKEQIASCVSAIWLSFMFYKCDAK